MKILYVFNTGRQSRIQNFSEEEFPKEMFYGYFAAKENYPTDYIELDNSQFRVSDKRSQELLDLNLKQHKELNIGNNAYILAESIDKINQYDLVIAIPDSSGLGLAELKRRGLIKPKIFFFAMGLASQLENLKSKNKLKYFFLKRKVKDYIKFVDKMIFLGEGELEFMNMEFSEFKSKFEFIPYAVDINFWDKKKEVEQEDYVLFIGNDSNRDFNLLLDITRNTPEIKYKFISFKMGNIAVPDNVELLTGSDKKKNIITDEEIRDYYLKSRFVILPLKESLQPSGQSTAVEAMNVGRTVLISDTKGFWERKYFKNGENIYLVHNTLDSWVKLVRELYNNKQQCQEVGIKARETILQNYSLDLFNKRLLDLINE